MRKGEETRQRIISEAAPIFNRHGYEGASMQEILDATGLEKGGLYRHFSSKEELALEAFRYAWEQATSARIDLSDTTQSPSAKLHAMIQRFANGSSPIAGGCPLFNTAVDTDDGNVALRKLARQALDSWRKRIVSIVEEGLQSGEFRQEVNPRQVANTIIATLEGALVLSRIGRTQEPLQDAQASLEVLLVSWVKQV